MTSNPNYIAMSKLPIETLKLAINGDKKSIEAVVQQYTPLVYRMVYAYKFLATDSDIEDLAQEGFIAIQLALETFNPPGEITWESWMTWAYYKVRDKVQSAARKESRHKSRRDMSIVPEGVELADLGQPIAGVDYLDYSMEPTAPTIKQLILDGCGSLHSKKAQIVCGKFGLMGHKPMRPVDLAKKHGISKQSVSGYLSRFSETIRKKHPELESLIS